MLQCQLRPRKLRPPRKSSTNEEDYNRFFTTKGDRKEKWVTQSTKLLHDLVEKNIIIITLPLNCGRFNCTIAETLCNSDNTSYVDPLIQLLISYFDFTFETRN